MSVASHTLCFQSRKVLIKKQLCSYKWQIKASRKTEKAPYWFFLIFLSRFLWGFFILEVHHLLLFFTIHPLNKITIIFNSLFIVLHITISNLEKLTVSLEHIIKERVELLFTRRIFFSHKIHWCTSKKPLDRACWRSFALHV